MDNIVINKKHYLWPKWRDKCLIKLNDIYDSNQNIKPLQKLIDEYDIPNNVMSYNQLISSIPNDWKRLIKNIQKEEYEEIYDTPPDMLFLNDDMLYDIKKIKSSTIYKIMINQK